MTEESCGAKKETTDTAMNMQSESYQRQRHIQNRAAGKEARNRLNFRPDSSASRPNGHIARAGETPPVYRVPASVKRTVDSTDLIQ